MKKLLIILIVFTSCSTFKSLSETDTSTKDVVTEIVETTKEGGVTTLDVPKYNFIMKDTVIETVNYKTKTILRTTFDNQGNQTIDCLEEELKMRLTKIEENQQTNIASESLTEREFNPQTFIYALIGLAVVFIVGMFVVSALILNLKKEIITS